MSDLTTLENVKAWLGDTGNTDDTLLSRLITQASAMIEAYLGRTLGTSTYTECYDGTGGCRLFLNQWPVQAVTSLYVGCSAISAAATGAGVPSTAGYRITASSTLGQQSLTLNGFVFQRGISNVTVTYTAGYDVIPSDIEQACIEIVGERYRYKSHIGQSSKTLGGQETIAYSLKDMPDYVRVILQPYRSVAF